MSDYKKFSASEIVIGVLFWLSVDGVAALLDMTGLGYLLATPLQSVSSFITSWWLSKKGGEKTPWGLKRQIMKQVSNFLPIIPTVTTSFIIEVVIHNRK